MRTGAASQTEREPPPLETYAHAAVQMAELERRGGATATWILLIPCKGPFEGTHGQGGPGIKGLYKALNGLIRALKGLTRAL